MAKVVVNFRIVEVAAVEAFKETAYLLGRTFSEVISERGAFDAHPDRDLVDTGKLRASQRLTIRGGVAEFSWSSEYAVYQHSGYQLRNGEEWKGRPWTEEGLQRFNLQETYSRLLKAKLDA